MTSLCVPCSASGVTNRDSSFILLVFRHEHHLLWEHEAQEVGILQQWFEHAGLACSERSLKSTEPD